VLKYGALSKITILKPNIMQLQHMIKVINNNEECEELTGNFMKDKRMLSLQMMNLKEHAEESGDSRLHTIMLTLGKDGVLIYTNDKFTHYRGEKVDDKDMISAIGAGDSYLGGYISGLLRSYEQGACIKLG